MDVSDIRFSVAFLSRQDLLVGVNTFNMLGQVGCFSRRMFAIRAMEVALAKVRRSEVMPDLVLLRVGLRAQQTIMTNLEVDVFDVLVTCGFRLVLWMGMRVYGAMVQRSSVIE